MMFFNLFFGYECNSLPRGAKSTELSYLNKLDSAALKA